MKRLAASVVIGGGAGELSPKDCARAARAVVEFAVGYARVNRRDFAAARRAIDAGEIAVTPDV